jgi:hypothetical protein
LRRRSETPFPADVVKIDVLHHGASPVRQIEEIDARLIRIDARLDRDARHRLLAREEQIEISSSVAARRAAFARDSPVCFTEDLVSEAACADVCVAAMVEASIQSHVYAQTTSIQIGTKVLFPPPLHFANLLVAGTLPAPGYKLWRLSP